MAAVNQEMEQLREAVRRGTRWNLILLVVLMSLTGVLLGYEYYQIKQLTKPENIVTLAEDEIEANYADIRQTLKEQIIKSAPRIAEKVSHRAVVSAPEAREQLVQFFGRQLAVGLDEGTELSAEEFRQILRENRDLVKETVQELKEVPEKTEKFVLNLEHRLEEHWDVDVRKEARFLVKAHRALNDKLERLSSSDDLDPEQLIERRIVRILRAIQVRELSVPGTTRTVRR